MSENTVVIGLEGKMYFGTAGQTPTKESTNEVKNAKDVTCSIENAMADITRRGSGGIRTSKPTIQTIKIEFDLLNAPGAPDVAALKAAAIKKTPVAILALDRDTDGEGPDGDFYVSGFSRGEPLEDAQAYSITLEPTDELRTPDWYEPSTSSGA